MKTFVVVLFLLVVNLQLENSNAQLPPIVSIAASPSYLNVVGRNEAFAVEITMKADMLIGMTLSGPTGARKVSLPGSSVQNGSPTLPQFTTSGIMKEWTESGLWAVTEVEYMIDGVIFFAHAEDLMYMGVNASLLHVVSDFDPSGPTLTNYTFTPSVVDVTSQAQIVTLTINAYDDISGVKAINAFLDFNQFPVRFFGSFNASVTVDTFEMQGTIPQGVEPGNYTLYSISMSDNAGNNVFLAPPGQGDPLLVISNTPDVSGPNILSLSVQQPINVTHQNGSIAIQLCATDQSGIYLPLAYFGYTDPLNRTTIRSFTLSPVGSNCYTGSLFLWMNSAAGSYDITNIIMLDNLRQRTKLARSDIVANGFPTSFSVISQLEDTKAPQVVSVTMNPSSILSRYRGLIEVYIDVTDETATADVAIRFLNFPAMFPLERVSGTNQNGTWYLSVPLRSPYPWDFNSSSLPLDSGFIQIAQIQTEDYLYNIDVVHQNNYIRITDSGLDCLPDKYETNGDPEHNAQYSVITPPFKDSMNLCGYDDVDFYKLDLDGPQLNLMVVADTYQGLFVSLLYQAGDAAPVELLTECDPISPTTKFCSIPAVNSSYNYFLRVTGYTAQFIKSYDIFAVPCGWDPTLCQPLSDAFMNCTCLPIPPKEVPTASKKQPTIFDNVGSTGWIIIGILLAVLILGAIVAVFFYRRHRKMLEEKEKSKSVHMTELKKGSKTPSPNPSPSSTKPDEFYTEPTNKNVTPVVAEFYLDPSAETQPATEHTTIVLPAFTGRLEIPYSEIEFKEEIGSGSFGLVYRGVWQRTPIAIKVCSTMSPDKLDAFLGEIKVMVQIRPHPNVIRLLGVSIDGPNPLVVLEHCGLGSLDKWVYSNRDLPDLKKLSLIKGIALGMLHLHKNNLVHRDLATRNILLAEGDIPKISDFGMSRFLSTDVQKTQSDALPVRWMAPESISDFVYSKKTDVWAFGNMVTEILNREVPFKEFNMIVVATKVKRDGSHPEIKVPIPEWLRETLLKCWEVVPDNRYEFDQIVDILSQHIH